MYLKYDNVDWARAYRLLKDKARREVNGFKVVYKNESFFHKLIAALIFFIPYKNRTTTIGKTVAFPSFEYESSDPARAFFIMAHELEHLRDWHRMGIKFPLAYLFPQVLSLLSVFAFLAFVSPWFLLFLLCLGFLAPLPSPTRTKLEIRGFSAGVILREIFGFTAGGYIDRVADRLTGKDYYYASRDKSDIIERLWKVSDDAFETELGVGLYEMVKISKNTSRSQVR